MDVSSAQGPIWAVAALVSLLRDLDELDFSAALAADPETVRIWGRSSAREGSAMRRVRPGRRGG